ncbi:hypothetical protein GCM10022415_33500 [Knoellia locipacati]|uniref:Hemerythrin-like domain-containing protein n=1 Tax=Knoellia locipacati TaxID=882824 RepID=A0A512T4T8_9MICO|nr:hemerythrin domain-containing protein [Knoellia locipacati]GEQ15237.1 hypothetical protein KLO01_32840 [Knoellia locipacati]
MTTTPHADDAPTSERPLVDTSAMPTIHTYFRRELRLAGGLVRGIPDRDLERAGVVVDHLDFLRRTLHQHHTIEDELLWPVLLERVPEELAPVVHLMESQHERVDALLAKVDAARPGFARRTTLRCATRSPTCSTPSTSTSSSTSTPRRNGSCRSPHAV